MEGEGNFLLEAIPSTDSGPTTFLDMTRNEMILVDHDHDFYLPFTVDNTFLVDEPYVVYEVACPAKSEGDSCSVSTTPERGTPVDCFSKEAGNALQDDLLIKCSN